MSHSQTYFAYLHPCVTVNCLCVWLSVCTCSSPCCRIWFWLYLLSTAVELLVCLSVRICLPAYNFVGFCIAFVWLLFYLLRLQDYHI